VQDAARVAGFKFAIVWHDDSIARIGNCANFSGPMRKASLPTLLLMLAMALLARGADSPTAEIPFQFHDGFILIQGRQAQSAEPMNFLLDSGAGASVLDLRSAKKLHMPLGKPMEVRGVESKSTAYQIPPIQATDGNARIATISLAVDLAKAQEICSEPVDGLIGVDFFSHRIVQIDFASHVIRFPAKADAAGTQTLPLRFRNGTLCVPISVNGSHPRWTRFDTGCNDALHWVIPRIRKTGPAQGVSIGFLTDARDQTLTSVRLGNQSLELVETTLHGQELFRGEAGLLGNGILSRFTVTVDTGHRRILLEPADAQASR
jgi:hypothetical protein